MSNHESDCIRAIHASPFRVVIAATGGGNTAVSKLLTVPGGSATLLEAVVPYSETSLTAWLGATPESFCSPETALRMATVAYRRAAELAGTTPGPLLGLGATCSLTSEPPKRGPHRIHVAVQAKATTQLYSLELAKGARDRSGEEALASQVVLRALAIACEANPLIEATTRSDEAILIREEHADPQVAKVWSGDLACVWSLPNGDLDGHPRSPTGLLSGSFDPFHRGHANLRDAAEKHLGGPVYFEIPIVNAEKPPLDYLTLSERLAQPFQHPILITTAPTFIEKARLLPGTVFAIGVDTARRVVDQRFHGDREDRLHSALSELRERRCSFLVAGRTEGENFATLADLEIPAGFNDLFMELPEADFRIDLSSTQIRHRTRN